MAIFPLASNKPELVNKARSIYKNFKTNIRLISTIAAILVKNIVAMTKLVPLVSGG